MFMSSEFQARVAVVLPSFNRPVLVEKTIKSVQAQTLKEWRLYIMDNSSDKLWPRMRNIYEKYAKTDPRIIIDHTNVPNEQRYKKWWCAIVTNKALFQLSKGEPYVVFTADDCVMMPNKLEVLSNFLDTHPEAQMVSGGLHTLHDDGSIGKFGIDVVKLSGLNTIDWVQPMFRRELINKIGKLDEPMGDPSLDGLFFTRIAKHAKVYGFTPWTCLDVTSNRTHGTRHKEKWIARAKNGELME